MESLPLHSEVNRSHGMSRHSGVQAITSLRTYTSFPRYTTARNNENKRKKAQYAFCGYHPGLGRIFEGSETGLIAAGWPPWKVEDAGEALKGWLPRKEKSFQKLEKIGEVTYIHVYRVLDLEQNNLITLKRHSTQATPSKHNNIIKLEGQVVSEMSSCMASSHLGLKFTEPQVKSYMKQLFCGLDYCHRQGILRRGILKAPTFC